MATRLSTLAPTNSSDANFRLWINEIHNSLIAFGWVQTSDTGQINYSTVTRPTTTNTYQGYAVYRMADSLQSTTAVYIRLDYGTGGNTDGPSIKFKATIGSTDGAGTLTGQLSTQIITTSSTAASATLVNCRTSGTTSSFRMMFFCNNIAHGWVLAIERDRNTSGTEVSGGVNIVFAYDASTAATTKQTQFLETGNVSSADTIWYAMLSQQTTQSFGGNVGIGPVRCQLGPMRNPMLSLFVCARGDFTNEATTTVTIYGASHTYIVLRPNVSSTSPTLNGVNADSAFGMLWE